MRRWLASGCLLLAGHGSGHAQAGAEFPVAATPLDQAALEIRLKGHTVSFLSPDTTQWEWRFDADGYFFSTIRSAEWKRASLGSGKWKIEGSRICLLWSKAREFGCGEVRETEGTLYLKRQNGDLVTLAVR
jgi:hypothetical protein